jgi:hypothetical protein
MSEHITPIGIGSGSQPIGRLGDFLKSIGYTVSQYETLAGLFPELPLLPELLSFGFRGFGEYVNAIEDGKFNFLLPFQTVEGSLPLNPLSGRAQSRGLPVSSLTPRTVAPRARGGVARASVDRPSNAPPLAVS